MNEKRRIIALIIILAVSIIVIASVTIFLLYRVAFEGQKARLAETAQSRARMMEAVARFDMQYSDQDIAGGAFAATLLQVFDAHSRFEGFGETGEFTLAERDGDEIVFLLSHRHRGSEDAGIESPLSRPIPFNSDIAEPMRRALSGESGIIVGLDYRGVRVLAAHEPVDVLNLGIVAKIDLSEIRAPFIKAGLLAAGIGLLIILIGTLLFLRISDPMIRRLGESEQRLRYALEGAQDGVWDWNVKTGNVIYSERWASMLGYDLDEIEPTFSSAEKLCHPDDNSRVTKAINDHLEKKTLFYTVELRMKAKSGVWKWILSRGRVMEWDTRGKPLRMIGTHHDITERKMTEDALRLQSEIAVNMSEGVYLVRASDGIIVYTNPKFEEIFGYGPGEMIGKHVSIVDFPAEKRPEETATDLMKILDEHGAWVGEIRNIKKDGTPFWSYASVSMFDHPDYGKVLVAVHTDITARKQAEVGLQASESKYRSLFLNMLNGFAYCKIILDENDRPVDWTYLEINDAFEKLTGLKRETVVGKEVTKAVPGLKESNPEVFDIYGKVALTGEPTSFEVFVKPLERWLYISVYCPQKGFFVAVFDNITERKMVEQALRESEERYRASVENMLDCFGVYSAVRDDNGKIIDFKIEYVNPAACENNLMTKEEQIGQRLLELLPAHRETGLFDEYCTIVETGKPLSKESLTYEDAYKTKRLTRAFDIRAVKLGDGFLAA